MKKLVWFVAGVALSLSVAVLGWPTVAVNTTNLDAATDSRAAARVDLLDAVQKLNVMIADRGIANGVAALTSAGGITVPKACLSGFTRYAVNYCHTNTEAGTSLVRDACTAIPVPSGSGALALNLKYYVNARSANAIAGRYAFINYYSAVSCGGGGVGVHTQASATAYEFVATAANTSLATELNDGFTPVVSGNAYVKLLDDTGNQGTGIVYMMGYFD